MPKEETYLAHLTTPGKRSRCLWSLSLGLRPPLLPPHLGISTCAFAGSPSSAQLSSGPPAESRRRRTTDIAFSPSRQLKTWFWSTVHESFLSLSLVCFATYVNWHFCCCGGHSNLRGEAGFKKVIEEIFGNFANLIAKRRQSPVPVECPSVHVWMSLQMIN